MGNQPFNHPYTPYNIQIKLMEAIQDAINNYKVGLFESPTGTGKTLSIICSSMSWLRDYKSESSNGVGVASGNDDSGEESDEPDWVTESYNKSLNASKSLAEEYEIHLNKLSKNHVHINKIKPKDAKYKRTKTGFEADAEADFIPKDYDEQNKDITKEINDLLKKIEGPLDTPELVQHSASIIYLSRTHSQLSQFSDQLRITSFPSSFSIPERIKFAPIASRKQLCIHPKVSKYKDLTSMNDACADLTKENKCELKSNDQELVKKFTDLNFTTVNDIEDVANLGRELKVCPYYSVRNSIDTAEIISLPYQLLLQKSSRDALSISIKDKIIVIDEAHNLIDVITSLNSVSVTQDELKNVLKSLKIYLEKFAKKLNSGNRVNLMKLIKLIEVLEQFITTTNTNTKIVAGKEININDIFSGTTADMVNIHNLEVYLAKSKIAYKIENYILSTSTSTTSTHSATPLLFKITSFLKCLSNPSSEGKFFWDTNPISINYMLLDPSEFFKDIIEQSRCVLLCGGTMEPMSDYNKFLFPYLPENKVLKFSCGHVIPKENLNVYTVGVGPSGEEFEFSFDKRNLTNMIDELGLAILKLCEQVPYGVVVFFPSYKYLDQVSLRWKQTKLYDRLNKLKKIYTEPKDSNVDDVLHEYSNSIQIDNNALLFSVVGGKLSEGINFSDNLARAIVMIGLPFPNAFSGELIAKRKYVIGKAMANGASKQEALVEAANFYENICMRAVNQSIGRAIRHINDYSVVVLLDKRYGKESIQKKLSGWVKERIMDRGSCTPFGEVLSSTRKFFLTKRVSDL